MGSCREILTLQLGSYANFVGAHFWNIQETSFNYDTSVQSEICHDILYREGLSYKGDITFTPRVICVDKNKSQAPIPLLEDDINGSEVQNKNDNLELVQSSKINKHPFIQDLDTGEDVSKKNYEFESTLRDWGDILRARLHPRSIPTSYRSDNEEIVDKIRMYTEECDNLQGFHILVDGTEAHSSILSYLDDEFSSKTRISFPVIAASASEFTWKESATRILQIFLNFHDCAQFSSLTVPLGCSQILSCKPEIATNFQDLVYNFHCHYHTSAIIASFIDTVSVPYRKQSNKTDLFDYTSGLTTRNWKFSAASLSLPFGLQPGMSMQQSLESRSDDAPLWSSLTPGAATEGSWYQTFGLRGSSDGDVLLQYLQYLSSSVSSVSSVSHPLPTLQPFPKIFSEHVSTRGSVDLTASRMPGFDVHSAPVLGGLHACEGVGKMIHSFSDIIAKINVRKLPNFEIEADALNDSMNSMLDYAKNLSIDLEME